MQGSQRPPEGRKVTRLRVESSKLKAKPRRRVSARAGKPSRMRSTKVDWRVVRLRDRGKLAELTSPREPQKARLGCGEPK